MMTESDVLTRPSLVEYKNQKFLMTSSPTNQNMPKYIELMKQHGVRILVRTSEPTYDIKPLQDEGIRVYDEPFDDGDVPPGDIITKWIDICKSHFQGSGKASLSSSSSTDGAKSSSGPPAPIAIHCVAGLGRTPVLVALALIEGGMDVFDAVQLIRKYRRGALNAKQIAFLEKYRPTTAASSSCCVIC